MKFSKLSTLILAFLLAFGAVTPAEANIFSLLRQKKEHHRHRQHHRHHDRHRNHDEFGFRHRDNHHGRNHRHSRGNFDRRGHGRG